jgi:hypothetical protein
MTTWNWIYIVASVAAVLGLLYYLKGHRGCRRCGRGKAYDLRRIDFTWDGGQTWQKPRKWCYICRGSYLGYWRYS